MLRIGQHEIHNPLVGTETLPADIARAAQLKELDAQCILLAVNESDPSNVVIRENYNGISGLPDCFFKRELNTQWPFSYDLSTLTDEGDSYVDCAEQVIERRVQKNLTTLSVDDQGVVLLPCRMLWPMEQSGRGNGKNAYMESFIGICLYNKLSSNPNTKLQEMSADGARKAVEERLVGILDADVYENRNAAARIGDLTIALAVLQPDFIEEALEYRLHVID